METISPSETSEKVKLIDHERCNTPPPYFVRRCDANFRAMAPIRRPQILKPVSRIRQATQSKEIAYFERKFKQIVKRSELDCEPDAESSGINGLENVQIKLSNLANSQARNDSIHMFTIPSEKFDFQSFDVEK